MGWRRIVTCLFLLLLLLLSGAVVEARPAPTSAHRKAAARRQLGSTEAFEKKQFSVHRKVASKAPKNTPESVNFNVDSYGATGDGHTDDTKAFQKTWATACSSAQPAVVLVPAGKKYLLKETPLSGPCKSKVMLKLDGTLVAPEDKSDWNKNGYPHWISFNNVDNLIVSGKGMMDGNGKLSWKNSCRKNPKLPCTFAPASLTFSSCNHLKVENIKLVNSPQIHMLVQKCHDVTLSHLTITGPGSSPETDGIHISQSEDIGITNAVIKTGDDCISIGPGTKNLYAFKTECGPGHGISIGSLGNKNSEAQVSNITIDTAHLSGTTNGARIKTWQGGKGYAKDIKFLNMVMDNVKNPIIIDQYYCTTSDPSKPKSCEEQASAVQLSNILFKNIRGTSATKNAIKLHCSESLPCRDIFLEDVELKTKGGGKKNIATSTCKNAVLSKSSNVYPTPCTSAATKDEIPQE